MYENKQGGRQKQRMLGLALAVFAVLVLFSELGRTAPGTVEIVPGEALAGSEYDVVMENLLKFEEAQKRQRLARNAAMFALSGVMAAACLLTSAQEEKKEEELRRLYKAGLIDRDEYNARRGALREEEDEHDPVF